MPDKQSTIVCKCDGYRRKEPDGTCALYFPGPWEFHCLSKENVFNKCPWNGMPVLICLGAYLPELVDQPEFQMAVLLSRFQQGGI